MKKKKRIDEILVENNLAENTKKALSLILAGKVMADGRVVRHAGEQLSFEANIQLININPYVSRAGLKLDGALKYFNTTPKDKICMDIGASTGGFTDCMLQYGAKQVYAVDVGKNLLDQKLKADPRVIAVENANFRYFSDENLKEIIEFVTIDVSFISIMKILSNIKYFTTSNAVIIAMLKPQFEAPADYLVKGVLTDEKLRKLTIEKVKESVIALGFKLINEIDSQLKGPKGNIEHFLYLQAPA